MYEEASSEADSLKGWSIHDGLGRLWGILGQQSCMSQAADWLMQPRVGWVLCHMCILRDKQGNQ